MTVYVSAVKGGTGVGGSVAICRHLAVSSVFVRETGGSLETPTPMHL